MFKFFGGPEKTAPMSPVESGEDKLKRLAEEYRLHFGDIREIKMTDVEAAIQHKILSDIKRQSSDFGATTHLDIYRLLKSHNVENVLAAEIATKINDLDKA